MTKKVKTAVEWLSEAVSIALGSAVVIVALYAVLFIDFTGNGRLWDAVRGVIQETVTGKPAQSPAQVVQIRRVPVRPPDMEAEAQNHMLLVPEVANEEISVPVLAANQPAPERVTDAPADKTAGKDWRVHLQGQLRKFSVYGKGEQRNSAVASAVSAPAAAPAPSPSPTAAAPSSAYNAGASAATRPGIGDHVSNVSAGASDGVRNFR